MVHKCDKNRKNGIRFETGLDEVMGALMRWGTVGLTYKRRRFTNGSLRSKYVEDGTPSIQETTEDTWANEGNVLNTSENVSVPQNECNFAVTVSDRKSVQYWQIVMAKQMCKLDETDLPASCLKDSSLSQSDFNHSMKGSVNCKKGKRKSILHNVVSHGSSTISDKIYINDDVSTGVLLDNHPNTILPFQNAFLRIIMSEKFSSLCKLLLENFKGIKVDDFFDFNLIRSRMRDGSYQRAPILFASDLQQVWGRIQNIGREVLSIAQSLSVLSSVSCCDVLGDLDYEQVTKVEKYWCKKCGVKGDGKECIICDSCEVAYHISCLTPPLLIIPSSVWYCPACTPNGHLPSPSR